MPEQRRHNRGSFLSWFFFLTKETVSLCHCVVLMYMHKENLWREFEL